MQVCGAADKMFRVIKAGRGADTEYEVVAYDISSGYRPPASSIEITGR